jgi:hypothetical protein
MPLVGSVLFRELSFKTSCTASCNRRPIGAVLLIAAAVARLLLTCSRPHEVADFMLALSNTSGVWLFMLSIPC